MTIATLLTKMTMCSTSGRDSKRKCESGNSSNRKKLSNVAKEVIKTTLNNEYCKRLPKKLYNHHLWESEELEEVPGLAVRNHL